MSWKRKDWLKLIAGIGLGATGLGAAGIGPLAGMFGGAAGAAGAGAAGAGGAAAGIGGTAGGMAGMFGPELGTSFASGLLAPSATPMITELAAVGPGVGGASMFGGADALAQSGLLAQGGPSALDRLIRGLDYVNRVGRFMPQEQQRPMPAPTPNEPPQAQPPRSLVAILNGGAHEQSDPYLEYLKRKRAGGLYGI
ncbi:MAG: hypothetical protein IT493_11950 [Gammaproteobacteria bacterium]|nr:hypothetical protein [Gammaproteobacteria bacterium]